MQESEDRLYATPRDRIAGFAFDESVVRVFADMIRRSVPGYETVVGMSGVLAARHALPGTRLYDLGCSLGATALAMATAVAERDCEVVAVDNSTAMLEELQLRLASAPPPVPVRAVLADITGIAIDRASVVALNYTLQFVPVAQRDRLLARIHRGLVENGVMILSEKIRFDDPQMEALMVDLYHAFKRRQGYSELEIAQKRSALENVLVPEALEVHRRRLTAAGFSRVDTWFQCFNFASLVAFK